MLSHSGSSLWLELLTVWKQVQIRQTKPEKSALFYSILGMRTYTARSESNIWRNMRHRHCQLVDPKKLLRRIHVCKMLKAEASKPSLNQTASFTRVAGRHAEANAGSHHESSRTSAGTDHGVGGCWHLRDLGILAWIYLVILVVVKHGNGRFPGNEGF